MNPPRWPLVALLLTACGHVTNPEDTDARPSGPDASGLIDASATVDARVDAPPGANDLGVPCDVNNAPCASGHQCVVLGLSGSPSAGYCSPGCTVGGTECVDGYSGPPNGQPACAVGGQGGEPQFCAIICTTTAECPSGLACTPVPDQMLSACDAQP